MVINIITCTLFFIIGYYSCFIINRIINKSKLDKINKEYEYLSLQILNNLQSNSYFISRVNNSINLSIKINDKEHILYYLTNSNDILLYKDALCILTSDDINIEIKTDIIQKINRIYSKEINDVIELFGIIISKSEFLKRLSTTTNLNINQNEDMSIEFNVFRNDIDENLDIDSILDKINLKGKDSLTENEWNFLKKQSDDENKKLR